MLSLPSSMKSASLLTRYVKSIRERQLFQAALRCASSLPPSGDGKVIDASAGSDDIRNDDKFSFDSFVFPWRFESSPLPRLIPGTSEQKRIGLLLTSKSQKVYGNSSLNAIVTAYMFLNVPWYELFWISHFKDELSSDISWAFTQGVANLLSNLPSYGGGKNIPMDRIITDRDDETCEIDFCETFEFSKNTENNSCSARVVCKDNSSDGEIGSTSANDANSISGVFDEKVIELYESSIKEVMKTVNIDSIANSDSKQYFKLRLKMIPYDYQFITLYAIPYLSRRNAKSDPNLLTFYREMLDKSSGERAPYLSQLRLEHLEGKGYMESTIIAQVLLWCNEIFYVQDTRTGEIVQGQNEEDSSTTPEMQQIPHLVRMERTVITKRDPTTGKFKNEQEDWIITDIDDLLDGNLLV